MLTALVLAALVLPPQTSDAAERAALSAMQQTLEAAQRERVNACQQRFEVNACLEQARVEHKRQMQPLIRREQWLDDRARAARAKASAERETIRQRSLQADEAEHPTPRDASAPKPLLPYRPVDPAAAIAKRAAKAEALQRQDEEAAQRQREAAERGARLKAHQQEVARRNAARKQPPAAKLPVPSASAVAAEVSKWGASSAR